MLRKPFRLAELARAVDSALSGKLKPLNLGIQATPAGTGHPRPENNKARQTP